MTKQEEIREGMAELEHDQWVEWSKAVANEVSPERRARWEKLWIPYPELTEEQKDQDRVWADKSIAELHSQGVVIKSGWKYIPRKCTTCKYRYWRYEHLHCNYPGKERYPASNDSKLKDCPCGKVIKLAVEPLIEEK